MANSTDWTELMMSELSTEARLFCFVFKLQTGRYPENWERVLGLAFIDGSLHVERLPEAEELRRVHQAALGAEAALGLGR